MNTRIAQYSARVMEAGWLAAVMVTPLFFNVWSSRVFEPDKLTLLRSIALLVLTAGLVRRLELGWPSRAGVREWLATPLVGPVLLVTAAMFISSATSVVPYVSFTGSYNRLQGFYTWTAYVMVFLAIVSLLRDRMQLDRLVDALILPSLPIALYGVVQRFGVDPMPWIGDVTVRVASTLGNSIFVAAYLIMAVPLTIVRLAAAFRNLEDDETNAGVMRVAGYLVLLIVQIVAIILSQSRGPQIGFLASTGFLVLLLTAMRGSRKAMLSVVVLGFAMFTLLVVVNLPNTPLAGFKDIPYIGRLGRIMETDEGTGKVRVLIWSGAVRLVSEGPLDRKEPWRYLVGFGPESMQVAYNPYYPPALGNLESRNASPDRSHNETFDWLINTGLLGFATYLLLFTSVFFYGLKWLGLIAGPRQRAMFLGLWAGGAILLELVFYLVTHTWQFFGVALPIGAVLGLFAFIAIRTIAGWQAVERPGSLLLAGLVAALIAHFIEIHVGIAIASTRILFFAMIGLMVVMGTAGATERMQLLGQEEPAVEAAPGGAKRRRMSAPRTGARRPSGGGQPSVPLWWNNTFLTLTVLTTLTFAFLVKTNTEDPTFVKDMLVVLWLQSLTWAIGSLILGSELIGRLKEFLPGPMARAAEGAQPWRAGLTAYVLITVLVPLVFGFTHWSLLHNGQGAGQGANTFSGLLIMFYFVLFTIILGWAAVINRFDPAAAQFSRGATVALYPVLAIALMIAILFTNINEVRADIYYKEAFAGWHARATQMEGEGKHTEAAQYYDMAKVDYDLARDYDSHEDFYLLFLGKALLEKADSRGQVLLTEFTTDGLPPGTSEYEFPATAEKAKARDNDYEAAFEVLHTAYDTSPLNTDHSANLGRAYQVWAERTVDTARKAERYQKSREWFKVAMDLSKHNSGLREEAAVTEYLDGKPDAALMLVDQALVIDPQYTRPLRLKASILRDQEKWSDSEAVYRNYINEGGGKGDLQALSGWAFVLGRQNRLTEAKEANLMVLAQVPNDLATLRNLSILARDLHEGPAGCEYVQRGLEAAPGDPGLVRLQQEMGCAGMSPPITPANQSALPVNSTNPVNQILQHQPSISASNMAPKKP